MSVDTLSLLGESLRRFRIGGGDRVVLAFSGGPDSLALLHLLGGLPPGRRPLVHAIHVDHGLRASSAEEAEAARRLAAAANVSCEVVRVRPGRRGGVEAAARDARYRALAERADGRPILTAHTLDDQAETVLLRLLRGTGPSGLAAIRASTRLHGARVVRPALGLRREALRAVLEERGLEPLRDPSNEDPRFARNRLRRELVPRLSSIAPAPLEALARLARLAAADERYLARRAARAAAAIEDEHGLATDRLLRLPLALSSRIVRARIREVSGRTPDAARVDEVLALARRGGELHLPHGVLARARSGRLRIAPGPTGRLARRPPAEPLSAELHPGRPIELAGVRLEVERVEAARAAPGELLVSGAEPPFRVRTVRPGERVAVPGVGRRLVSDLLAEARVAREDRPRALVVEAAGTPIWLVGVRPLCALPAAGEPAWRLRASKPG